MSHQEALMLLWWANEGGCCESIARDLVARLATRPYVATLRALRTESLTNWSASGSALRSSRRRAIERALEAADAY